MNAIGAIRPSLTRALVSKAGFLGESVEITSTSDMRIDVQLSRIRK